MTLDCGMQRLLVVVQPQAELFVLVHFIAGIERCSCSVALDRRRDRIKLTPVMNATCEAAHRTGVIVFNADKRTHRNFRSHTALNSGSGESRCGRWLDHVVCNGKRRTTRFGVSTARDFA